MNELALLLFLLSQATIVLIGFVVLWTARSRPRTVATVIGVLVAVGLAGVWFGSNVIAEDPEAWHGWYRGGLVLVVIGCPAWLLIPVAREAKGGAVGPIGRKEWAQAAFGYLVACWMLVFALGVILFLVTTPAGQFR